MQQNRVSNYGDDSDDLAEDKKSLMLKGEEGMLAIKKLGEGAALEGHESIVRESVTSHAKTYTKDFPRNGFFTRLPRGLLTTRKVE